MPKERVNQSSALAPRRRVNNHSLGFFNHKKGIVFINYVEGNIFCFRLASLWLGKLNRNAVPRLNGKALSLFGADPECPLYERQLRQNNMKSEFDVYVMHSNLEDSDKEYIKSKVASNINPIYIFMDESLFKGAPTVKRYPYEIYYRIFAPIMLPKELDRVLYIDCDLVVHKNIDPLYNMSFQGNYFIACTQIRGFMQWFNRLRLTVGKDHTYINTGVMMINLKELREVINIDEIFKFIRRNGWRMTLYDQDVIFKFFGNKIIRLIV
jgi:hypothetical protein